MRFKPRVFDPRLKLDVINGCMPEEFKSVVKSHHIYKWKKEKWSQFVGNNYYNKKEFTLQFLKKETAEQRNYVKGLEAQNEIMNLVLKTGSNSKEFEKLLFKNKSEIIKCIEKNKKLYSVKHFSKLLNLNKNTYYDWKQLDKQACTMSKNFICIKRHPNRVTIEEEERIAELLRDKKYEHYPISSLIWMARYENWVYAGRGVWDRVKKDNFITRVKPKKRKKHYDEGLRAEYANQFLHADVTYFKLLGGKTYFIYIVKDNYSRLIKSWAVSDSINPRTRMLTFKSALADISLKQDIKISFVVDSGNENRANMVKDFLNTFQNVELKFARKDIRFSNSMIERYNLDLKYMYLYRERIKNLAHLRKSLEIAVKDHNYTKRMERLNGQTPYEVYHGIPAKGEWILEQWKESRKKRKEKLDRLICCLNKEED